MSYGDDIMTTGFIRKIRTRFPKNKIVIGDGKKEYLSPVFWHNPNIDHINFIGKKDKVIWVKDYPSHRPYINYSRSTRARSAFTKFKPIKGELYFTESEIVTAKHAVSGLRSFVVIEPNVKGTFAAANRNWGFKKWQKVVNQLCRKTVFVQLGKADARSLKGVVRIITKDFRAACAILSLAKLFVGTEGGLHHAAAALGVSGVVIFGGRISPEIIGYTNHTNLYFKHPGSPCGRISRCDHCRKCMQNILVSDVIEAIKKTLKSSSHLF